LFLFYFKGNKIKKKKKKTKLLLLEKQIVVYLG